MDRNPQYFEGVLQLRNPTQEIIDFVATEIEKKDNVWIAKSIKLKNGIDLEMSSNKFLKEIGKKLNNKFTGVLKTSKKLFSRNRLTQKEVWRGCVLFKYLNIKKGDKIIYRGDQVEIVSIGKDVLGKIAKTHQKIHIKFSDI